MARKNNGGQLLPWMSARKDCREKRFLQVGNSLFVAKDSPFKKLTSGAQILYLCLAMESGGKREVSFSRTTALKYGLNKNTFARSLKELEEKCFISVVPEKSEPFKPTVYRFVFDWKTDAASQ